MIARLPAFAVLAVFLASAAPADVEKLRAQLREAIVGGADYAGNVLLEASGQSRCDYDILTSQWSPYEPAWHTGQIIFGLRFLAAYYQHKFGNLRGSAALPGADGESRRGSDAVPSAHDR